MAHTNAWAGIDDGRRASLRIEFRKTSLINARQHPPRRQQEQELWDTRRRLVSRRANSTKRYSLSALIDDARCIARSHRTAMRWAVKNE